MKKITKLLCCVITIAICITIFPCYTAQAKTSLSKFIKNYGSKHTESSDTYYSYTLADTDDGVMYLAYTPSLKEYTIYAYMTDDDGYSTYYEIDGLKSKGGTAYYNVNMEEDAIYNEYMYYAVDKSDTTEIGDTTYINMFSFKINTKQYTGKNNQYFKENYINIDSDSIPSSLMKSTKASIKKSQNSAAALILYACESELEKYGYSIKDIGFPHADAIITNALKAVN